MIDYIKHGLKAPTDFEFGKILIKDIRQVKIGDKETNWKRYIFEINLKSKKIGGVKKIYKIVFADENSGLIASKMNNFKTKTNYSKLTKEEMQKINTNKEDTIYDEKHLVAGSKTAKHKIAVFSNPMCGHCVDFTPKLIEDARKHPDKLAVYHYSMRFGGVVPSETLTRLDIVDMLSGYKYDIVDVIYKIEGNQTLIGKNNSEDIIKEVERLSEKDLNITQKNLYSESVEKELENTLNKAIKYNLQSTPSIIIDGEFVPNRDKYREIVGIEKDNK